MPEFNSQSDADLCAAITRHHARTFAAASWFLPDEKRRAAFAVYAFCRVADDIVDEAARGSTTAASELERHRAALTSALKGHSVSALFRELTWAMRTYRIPAAPFHSLINMLRVDLSEFEFETWAELEEYCGGVASTVGEMCAHVFGLPRSASERTESLLHARTLGVALQLTNILRDVGEDAARNRCYLPTEDLAKFDIARSEIITRSIKASDSRWQALMRFEIQRTRDLYEQSAPGLAMLDGDAQCCARICAWGYAAILDAIERRHYDSLHGRARIRAAGKARIMLRAWIAARSAKLRPSTAGARTGDSPLRA
ncbi:MAG: phytoene/squalene synthase family protein [Gemmatimonadaceae bacterium]